METVSETEDFQVPEFLIKAGPVETLSGSQKYDRWGHCQFNMAAPTDSTRYETNLETAVLQSAESRIRIHNFSDTFLNTVIRFHVMKMEESFFLWIGHKESLDNLAMAMKTKFVRESY